MPELSREQFTRHVIEVVRKRFPLARVGRSTEPFSLRINGRIASLESLYRLTLLRPENMEHQVERWAVEMLRASEGIPDSDAPFSEMAERVMPIVFGSECTELHAGLFTQEIVDGLRVSYVIDGDRMVAHISTAQIEKWNVSIDALHEKAIENLMSKSQEITADAAQDEEGVVNLVLFNTLDGYDSSRILLPNLHDRLRPHLGSPFITAVPNRDILLCFRNDEATIENLRTQISHDYRTMPHQVTERLYLVTYDGLAPYGKV